MTLCGQCGRSGHNRRTCPSSKKRKAPTGRAGKNGRSKKKRAGKQRGGGRSDAEDEDQLPPTGRLAFVNAIKDGFARDFLLPCLCDDVPALLALVCACPTLRDLVTAQLTRLELTANVHGCQPWARWLSDTVLTTRFVCFIGANLLELHVKSKPHWPGGAITDKGLEVIAWRCPNLRRFSALYCREMVGMNWYRCQHLEEVDLTGSNQVSDTSIKMLVRHCRKLAVLKIGDREFPSGDELNERVTDASLRAIGEHCKSLTTLSLRGCVQVTNAGVKAVAKGCTALSRLDISFCDRFKVTKRGVLAVAKHRGKALVHFFFMNLGDGLSDEDRFKIVKKQCPALEGERWDMIRYEIACDYDEKGEYAKAVKYYQMCADTGMANAQFCLGTLYERGQGVTQSHERAAHWYTKAAEQGDARAKHHLAFMYLVGKGVEQDAARAAPLFTEAAERGSPDAQYNLGRMYELGRGVEKDLKRAAYWYAKVAERWGGIDKEVVEALARVKALKKFRLD